MRKVQDKNWEKMYKQIMAFMRKNKRKPSRHYIEDHIMFNWIKYNKKRYSHGLLAEHHIKKFEKLLATAQKYRHVNQYDYPSSSSTSALVKGAGVQLSIAFDGEFTHPRESDN